MIYVIPFVDWFKFHKYVLFTYLNSKMGCCRERLNTEFARKKWMLGFEQPEVFGQPAVSAKFIGLKCFTEK